MILAVCPLGRLAAWLDLHRPSHVVSLLSPGSEPPMIEGVQRLSLAFNDIAAPAPSLVPPSPETIERLLDFGQGWDGVRPLLVHCWAGVSRSTASAYVLACSLAPHRDEAALARVLRDLSPSATPNQLMVSLSDAALGRQGRMTAAIASIGRGAEAFEGEAFAWDLSR